MPAASMSEAEEGGLRGRAGLIVLLGTIQFALSAAVGAGVAWAGEWMDSPLRAMGVVIAACVALMFAASRMASRAGA